MTSLPQGQKASLSERRRKKKTCRWNKDPTFCEGCLLLLPFGPQPQAKSIEQGGHFREWLARFSPQMLTRWLGFTW